MMLKQLSTVAGALALFTGAAHAQMISVSHNGAVQYMDPLLLSSGSFEEAYDYGFSWSPFGFGFQGDGGLEDNTIHTFMVQDTAGDLALFNIYKGAAGGAIAEIFSTHDLDFLVQDDPLLDIYQDLGLQGDGSYKYRTAHGWLLDNVSDGFVLGTFAGDSDDWSLTQRFSTDGALFFDLFDQTVLNYGGMNWKIFGANGFVWDGLALDKEVIFAATPEPSTIAFFALAGLGAIATMRRRKGKSVKS